VGMGCGGSTGGNCWAAAMMAGKRQAANARRDKRIDPNLMRR
jgi:hypothetical protein